MCVERGGGAKAWGQKAASVCGARATTSTFAALQVRAMGKNQKVSKVFQKQSVKFSAHAAGKQKCVCCVVVLCARAAAAG